MSDYVKREDVLRILTERNAAWNAYTMVSILPTADVVERELYQRALSDVVRLSVERKTGKWIPVTERLPDVWKHVITFDEDDGVRVNWRCGDNVSWSMGYHVTHWMPLPEPPKDGEE